MSRMGRKALQDWLFKGNQEEYKSDIDINPDYVHDPSGIPTSVPLLLSDDEKVEELLDVILEKFKDYRTTGYVENCLIERLINRLLDNRQSRRNEIDAEENVLADDMNDLVGKLQMLSKQEQV